MEKRCSVCKEIKTNSKHKTCGKSICQKNWSKYKRTLNRNKHRRNTTYTYEEYLVRLEKRKKWTNILKNADRIKIDRITKEYENKKRKNNPTKKQRKKWNENRKNIRRIQRFIKTQTNVHLDSKTIIKNWDEIIKYKNRILKNNKEKIS